MGLTPLAEVLAILAAAARGEADINPVGSQIAMAGKTGGTPQAAVQSAVIVRSASTWLARLGTRTWDKIKKRELQMICWRRRNSKPAAHSGREILGLAGLWIWKTPFCLRI